MERPEPPLNQKRPRGFSHSLEQSGGETWGGAGTTLLARGAQWASRGRRAGEVGVGQPR